MAQLTSRQEYLLGLIVQEYVNTPIPVSSKGLVESFGLDFSSATVRNEMAVLEQEGLVAAPHTSAGRVPTEAGYRYFVQRLLGDSDLAASEKRMIRRQFHQAYLDMRSWLRLAASVLAQTVRSASLVTEPMVHQARFKHLELIATHGRLVLMVLVLDGGDVRQQMLTLAEPVGQEQLSQVASRLTTLCTGKYAAQLQSDVQRLPALEREVVEIAAELLERAQTHHYVIHYDGLANILDPTSVLNEFAIENAQEREELSRAFISVDGTGARQALHLLEEQNLLEDILTEALSPETNGIQVLIAGNGRWEKLSHTGIVLSRYGVHGHAAGAVGVLGPTRLHYGRAISAVQYVAGLMSDMLIEFYGQDESAEMPPGIV